jgi:hypothetical protein
MAAEYPDLMNDYMDARQRFQSGAVQYLAEFPPDPASAGRAAQMSLILQNAMDVSVDVALHIALPEPRGKLRRLPQPLFEIYQPDVRLTLENGEVARLSVPVHVLPHVPPGEYVVTMHVRSEPREQGMRIRSEQGANRMGDLRIRHPQGLGITPITPWGFQARSSEKQAVSLRVGQAEEPHEDIDLKPRFESLWTPPDWQWVAFARREVNDRRIHVAPELTLESIYLPLMQETQAVFADCGIQLHVGEAIFATKILAYTVMYLMEKPDWQDCLLVPIYAYAQANEQPTHDVLWLVTQLGYTHLLELSVAISFALIEDALGYEAWDPAEQRGLRYFIVECLSGGTELPSEFLYLPLVLGGLAVANQLTIKGESASDSLRLLEKAKAERADLFADPDLQEVNTAFERLMAAYTQG